MFVDLVLNVEENRHDRAEKMVTMADARMAQAVVLSNVTITLALFCKGRVVHGER